MEEDIRSLRREERACKCLEKWESEWAREIDYDYQAELRAQLRLKVMN